MNMIKIEKTNTIFAYYKKMPEDKNLQTFDSITKVVLIFTLNKFKTHTAIVIRALPEACLIIIKIQTTIFKHSPMPFSWSVTRSIQ